MVLIIFSTFSGSSPIEASAFCFVLLCWLPESGIGPSPSMIGIQSWVLCFVESESNDRLDGLLQADVVQCSCARSGVSNVLDSVSAWRTDRSLSW